MDFRGPFRAAAGARTRPHRQKDPPPVSPHIPAAPALHDDRSPFVVCRLGVDYPRAMNRGYVALLSLLYCATLSAGIYRWVDADGRVHFSDRREQGAESLGLKGTPAQHQAAQPPPAGDTPYLGPYSAFEIVTPTPNETLTQESTSLAVSLLLDPPLDPGQQLGVLLDGASITVENSATQFRLTGLSLGSHSLQARIQSADGTLVARTALQTFHLRKAQQAQQPGLLR